MPRPMPRDAPVIKAKGDMVDQISNFLDARLAPSFVLVAQNHHKEAG